MKYDQDDSLDDISCISPAPLVAYSKLESGVKQCSTQLAKLAAGLQIMYTRETNLESYIKKLLGLQLNVASFIISSLTESFWLFVIFVFPIN